jgi:hypothetical protein
VLNYHDQWHVQWIKKLANDMFIHPTGGLNIRKDCDL